MFVTGILVMFGLLLLLNPEFASARWPWELNGLDARIFAAWPLGWAILVRDDGLRRGLGRDPAPARLFILNGLALMAVAIVFRDEFLPGRGSAVGFTVFVVTMTS